MLPGCYVWHLPYIRGASACQVQGSRPIDAFSTNVHTQTSHPLLHLRSSHQYYRSGVGLNRVWVPMGQERFLIPQISGALLKCPQAWSEAFITAGTYIVLCLWLPRLGSLSGEDQFPIIYPFSHCYLSSWTSVEQPLKINCPKNCVHIFMYPESNIFVPCLILSLQLPAKIDDLLDLTHVWEWIEIGNRWCIRALCEIIKWFLLIYSKKLK